MLFFIHWRRPTVYMPLMHGRIQGGGNRFMPPLQRPIRPHSSLKQHVNMIKYSTNT